MSEKEKWYADDVREKYSLSGYMVYEDYPEQEMSQIVAVCPSEEDAVTIAVLRERVRVLEEALKLVMPLARGYKPKGQTVKARATCKEWLIIADDALGATVEEPTQGAELRKEEKDGG